MLSNRSFARRRAMFSSTAAGLYVRASVDSCMDLGSEDGDASSVSARSTSSLKSFRNWKKAQRKLRLRKAASAFEFPISGNTYRKSHHGREHVNKKMAVTGEPSTLNDVGSLISERNGSTSLQQRIADEEFQQLPYYSSSPLTSSESDSDLSSQEQGPALTNQGFYQHSLQSKRQDPLERRSYPFRYPNQSTSRSRSVEETHAGLNDRSLLQDIAGRNERPHHPRSANFGASKSCEEDPTDTSYDNHSSDVFRSGSGSFTITVPMNSPTKPSFPVAIESVEKPSSQTQQDILCEVSEQCRINRIIERSNKKRNDWRKKNSCDHQLGEEPATSRPSLQKQKALELDGGMYFLPPLIATAVRNQQCKNTDSLKSEHDDHQNSTSSYNEKSRENIYREDTEVSDNLQEDILEPAPRALPESDTCSLATNSSVVEEELEPTSSALEACAAESEVQVTEVPGETTTSGLDNPILEDTSVERLEPVFENYYEKMERPLLADIATEHSLNPKTRTKLENPENQAAAEGELNADRVPPGSFTHKVANDKNCPVCNPRNGGNTTSVKSTLLVKAMKPEDHLNDKTEDSASCNGTHSHKVGDYRECPECTSPHSRPNDDPLTGLCCIIL